MIKVQKLMDLLSREPQRLHQERDPFPDPWGSIGDKEHLIRLSDSESVHVGVEESEHRIRSLERRIHHRSKVGIPLAFGVYHIDDQHLRFTPRPRIAPAPLFGL